MSKEKLTLEHLSAYLPYELKVLRPDNKTVLEVNGIVGSLFIFQELGKHETFGSIKSNANKPVLRPMIEIVDYFSKIFDKDPEVTDFLNVEFLDEHGLDVDYLHECLPESLPYGTLKVLLKHHFDVYGLIDKGLAVSIHDVG